MVQKNKKIHLECTNKFNKGELHFMFSDLIKLISPPLSSNK